MSTFTGIQLSADEVRAVREFVARTDHAQRLRRALAILWLGQGEPAQRVADRLCVSRTTVYNWAARFQERSDLEIAARVDDAARPGRPRLSR
jgi:transposase